MKPYRFMANWYDDGKITGITGQDGPYLSKLLLEKGYEVIGVIDPLRPKRLGNLEYLSVLDDIDLVEVSLLGRSACRN